MEDDVHNIHKDPPSSALQRARAKSREMERAFNYKQAKLLVKAEAQLKPKQEEARNLLHEVMAGQRPATSEAPPMRPRSPEGAEVSTYYGNPLKKEAMEKALEKYQRELHTLSEQNGDRENAARRVIHILMVQHLLNDQPLNEEQFVFIKSNAHAQMVKVGYVLDDAAFRAEFIHMLSVAWSRHWIQKNKPTS